MKLFSAGYPHDKRVQVRTFGFGNEGAMKLKREREAKCHRNILGHSIDVKAGQSGSPIWTHIERDGKTVCQLVGVVISVNYGVNFAVAITEEVLTQIANWAPKTFQFSDGLLSIKK